jgi:large subunit ribosomal protein L4
MATVTVYDLKKKSVGKLDLSDDVFGAEVNEGLMYEVLKAQLASRRSGTAKAKARPEVSGSTKKIYKQKGTGAARHGAKRAATFVKGGVALGPVPHSYAYRPPRAMRLGAMRSALSLKVQEGRLTIVDAFSLDEVKTKRVVEVLDTFEAPSALIVDAKDNDKLRLSVRNLPRHQFLPPEGVNLYDVLRHDGLILTRAAATALDQRFGGGS